MSTMIPHTHLARGFRGGRLRLIDDDEDEDDDSSLFQSELGGELFTFGAHSGRNHASARAGVRATVSSGELRGPSRGPKRNTTENELSRY